MRILNSITKYKYRVLYTLPTRYGKLECSKYKRNGYSCMLVWGTSEYDPRPILVRLEDGELLWGAFDCTNEKVAVEVEGETYTRQRTKKTEWFPLTITANDELKRTLLEIMESLYD